MKVPGSRSLSEVGHGVGVCSPSGTPQAQGRPVVLRVRGLVKAFGARLVLDGVDLDVRAGEVVALVGENDAGKSTLVRCVGGGLRPDGGEIVCTRPGISVVWQDLALCDDLDVVANLFLGREPPLLAEGEMEAVARRLLDRLGLEIDDLRQPVRLLSGGQRQLVAVARATADRPDLLVLDEPMAALGDAASRRVEQLVHQLRLAGTSVLLVSHRPEQVFELADRIVVLREGRIVAETSPVEAHPDEVVALMEGVEVESTAQRQLRRLRGLVDQLAGEEPSSSLPLILSAAATALGQDQLCVHLLSGRGDARLLRRFAAVGLAEPLLGLIAELPIGPGGGPIGLAAESGAVVVVEDMTGREAWAPFAAAGLAAGVRSCWAAPIDGEGGLVGIVSGFAGVAGRPRADLLELVFLYAGYVAAALQREAAHQQAQALRRSHSLQREFLSRVSHELRTPLTAIHGYASSLRQPDVTWDTASVDRFLGAIAGESARMSRLVADLLDSSAIESGVLRLNPDWCDLGLVLHAALACLPAEQAGRVELSCDPALGPVWADHDRLEQVVVNLMENGLHHTAPGTRLRVSAAPGRRPGTVAVRVADDGPGIPPEEAERLFQPWARGRTNGPGAGLGLSIVRGIVDAHGGEVSLEPVTNGTSFLVELPVDPPEERQR